jgi:peptidyl-prolyl cis-trans isomerase D
MIKLIHRHNKIITYVFLFVALCFMFSGLGLDLLQDDNAAGRYAIKINNQEISPLEFERTRENLRERYRRMFGDNFDAIAKSFNLNVTQQAVDSLIDSNILEQEASRWGFAGSDEAVARYIRTQVFAGREISKDGLRALLQSIGMNYRQFSNEIKGDLSRQALSQVVQDVAFVGQRDVEAQYSSQETLYSLTTALIPAASLASQVPTPNEDELRKRYAASATSFEIPAQVAYEYLLFDPKEFEKDVPVLSQDLEFYYTENLSKFKTPEQARVRSITLLYPKDSDPKAMAAVKEKAKLVHDEALSGKPFVELVQKYSDDLPSKLAAGDKGWIQRGQGDKAFDKAVFAAATGGIAELVESDYGFQIVKVEEKKEAGTKSFAEVKASIESQIRTREAPSFAAAKAQELVAYTKKNNLKLSQAAEALRLPAPKIANLGQQTQATDTLAQKLTQKALQIPAAERLIASVIDVGEATVALQVKEFKEPSIPPFEAVKDAVTQGYVKEQSLVLAEAKARELLESATKDVASITSLASAKGYTLTGPFDISRAKPSNPAAPSIPRDLIDDALKARSAPMTLSKLYKTPEGFLVASISKIIRPDVTAAAAVEKIKEYRETATESAKQQTLRSILSLLKTRSKIDVDPSLL